MKTAESSVGADMSRISAKKAKVDDFLRLVEFECRLYRCLAYIHISTKKSNSETLTDRQNDVQNIHDSLQSLVTGMLIAAFCFFT